MFRYIILFIFCLGVWEEARAQSRTMDSLRKLASRKNLPDTISVKTTLEYAYELRYIKPDSTTLLAQQMLKKARAIKYQKGIALGLYVEGIVYASKGKQLEALENYFQSLSMFEKMKDEVNMARVINNTAIVYYYQKNYDKADVFLKRSLAINERIKNYAEIARCNNNLGRNAIERNKPQEALEYFRKGLFTLKKYNISIDNSVYYCNVAEAKYMLKEYEEALHNAEKSLEVARKMGNKRIEARSSVVQGAIYLELGDIGKAKRFLEEGTPIAQKLRFPEEQLLSLQYSHKLYEKIQDYQKAYQYFKSFKAFGDSLSNETTYKNTLQREYEYNEQQRKLRTVYEEDKRRVERNAELWIRYSLIGGVLLALGLVFFAYRAFRIKSKAFTIISQQQEELQVMNEELTQNQEEILAQRGFIEDQNKVLSRKNEMITQSITAALTIQQALLPFDNRVKQILKEYFVLYHPRDIVSGDFYWIESIENKAIIVAADCTGHGVPGAFMSLVAINLLERVILQQEITSPAKILSELHNLVRYALKQDEMYSEAGMDLAVAVMDLKQTENKETTVYFAGAKRPLYYIDSQNPYEVCKIGGSRRAIGGMQNENIMFDEVKLCLPANSSFYISSDGFADQNDKKRKRLSDKPILDALQQHYPSLPAQYNALEELLEKQMEDTYQRDDILLLGVKC